MSGYDYDRPFINQSALHVYVSKEAADAIRYGKTVRAGQLSNIEYKIRYGKFRHQYSMKPPPSCGRIFMGYLVVRKLGTPGQYETWMPDHVFDELYEDGLSDEKIRVSYKVGRSPKPRTEFSAQCQGLVSPVSVKLGETLESQPQLSRRNVRYEEIVELCAQLSYRDKFRLAQLLIQLARKEEEEKNPDGRNPTVSNLGSIEYVAERLLKSKPGKTAALLNFIGAMFQFQGGISDEDKEAIVTELQRKKYLSIDNNGRVSYRD